METKVHLVDINNLLPLTQAISKSQLVSYVMAYRPSIQHIFKQQRVETVASVTIDLLKTLHDADLLALSNLVATTASKPTITPFNAATEFSKFGYDYVIPEVDGIEAAEFSTSVSKYDCPIQKGFVDYSSIQDERVDKLPFAVPFAVIARMFAAYTSWHKGMIKPISITTAMGDLLQFNQYFGQGMINALLSFGVTITPYIAQLPTARDTMNEKIMYGHEYASCIYRALINMHTAKIPLKDILKGFNAAFYSTSLKLKGSKYPEFFVPHEGKIMVNFRPPLFPRYYGDKPISLNKKTQDVSFDQAIRASEESRSVRGLNIKQQGEIARNTYAGITIEPAISDLMIFVANFAPLYAYKNIVLYSDSMISFDVISKFIDAAATLDEDVILVVPYSSTNYAKYTTTDHIKYTLGEIELVYPYQYRPPGTKMTIVAASNLVSMIHGIFVTTDYKLDDDTIIVDLRHSNLTVSVKKINELKNTAYASLDNRVSAWKNWKYKAITRHLYFPTMANGGLKVHSPADPHNLIVFVTNADLKWPDWSYDLSKPDEAKDYWASSIICNVLRTTYPITGVTPYYALGKYGYRVPQLMRKVRGKRSSNSVSFETMEGDFAHMTEEEFENTLIYMDPAGKERAINARISGGLTDKGKEMIQEDDEEDWNNVEMH